MLALRPYGANGELGGLIHADPQMPLFVFFRVFPLRHVASDDTPGLRVLMVSRRRLWVSRFELVASAALQTPCHGKCSLARLSPFQHLCEHVIRRMPAIVVEFQQLLLERLALFRRQLVDQLLILCVLFALLTSCRISLRSYCPVSDFLACLSHSANSHASGSDLLFSGTLVLDNMPSMMLFFLGSRGAFHDDCISSSVFGTVRGKSS